MSQGEPAKLLGRPPSIVSSLASGGRRIDVIELLAIAEIIELDLPQLIREVSATPIRSVVPRPVP